MMKIDKITEGKTVTIKPEGWLDTVSSPELGEAVDTVTEAEKLVLDFDKVEYMASAGLRQVVAAHKKAQSLGAGFSVINVCPDVYSIFKMTGIFRKMDVKEK